MAIWARWSASSTFFSARSISIWNIKKIFSSNDF
jgi:hypothetical protein